MESKRINVIPKNPNALFKKWLREYIDDAEKNKKKISKVYQRALDSLNKYPLTLFSGHDCAILENFGPKICHLLDEKLEKHLSERLDLFQFKSYKDKIVEVQRRESNRISDLVRSVEAACLIDTTFNAESVLKIIDEEEEDDAVVSQDDVSLNVSNQEKLSENVSHSVSQDVEIPDELLSSSAESEDSLELLIQKYNPEAANKRRKLKRKKRTEDQPVIERMKKLSQVNENEILSQSPNQLICSPISTVRGGVKLKKFKTFDSTKESLAGPSYASSPISKFLDVETSSPVSKCVEDEFDKLVTKYDLPSPIPVILKEPLALKQLTRKPSKSKLKTISEDPTLQTVQEPSKKLTRNPSKSKLKTSSEDPQTVQKKDDEENEEIAYVSIDDINPLDFNVILLIDIQETSGKLKASTDELVVKLKQSSVKIEIRKLHVGDFVWIAQHKVDKTNELVLPYIIERKRLDDLSSSIKDGRFHEQKFRLNQSGIENVVYLIESHLSKKGKLQHTLPFTTLLQAATNTQIHSKFQVKFTENSQHTILYLTVMTSFIENIFNKRAPLKFKMMDFKSFNQSAVKQRKCTVRETFIKHLLSLKGLSVDIALEITKHYPTPRDLIEKYSELSKIDGESLLNKITIGDIKRKIPAPISKSLYYYYMLDKI